jgi:transposase
VKLFLTRQTNNMADTEAICEVAHRPTLRFVAVKSEAKKAAGAIFSSAQRTKIIRALRGHLGEYGLVAPQGPP